MANSAFCVYLVVVVFVRFSPQHYLAAPSACHQPKFSQSSQELETRDLFILMREVVEDSAGREV